VPTVAIVAQLAEECAQSTELAMHIANDVDGSVEERRNQRHLHRVFDEPPSATTSPRRRERHKHTHAQQDRPPHAQQDRPPPHEEHTSLARACYW